MCKFCGAILATTTPMVVNIPEDMKHLEYVKIAMGRMFVTCALCHMTWTETHLSKGEHNGSRN